MFIMINYYYNWWHDQKSISGNMSLNSLFINFIHSFQESLMLYQMGDYERCKQLGESICLRANTYHSPNYNSIAGMAKCTISSAYKMERNFTKAEELLDSSTEVSYFYLEPFIFSSLSLFVPLICICNRVQLFPDSLIICIYICTSLFLLISVGVYKMSKIGQLSP